MSETRANTVNPGSSTTLTVTLSQNFKLIFIGVLSITMLSMLIACALVVIQNETEQGKALFEFVASLTKMGFGAMLGLLGGKTI